MSTYQTPMHCGFLQIFAVTSDKGFAIFKICVKTRIVSNRGSWGLDDWLLIAQSQIIKQVDILQRFVEGVGRLHFVLRSTMLPAHNAFGAGVLEQIWTNKSLVSRGVPLVWTSCLKGCASRMDLLSQGVCLLYGPLVSRGVPLVWTWGPLVSRGVPLVPSLGVTGSWGEVWVRSLSARSRRKRAVFGTITNVLSFSHTVVLNDACVKNKFSWKRGYSPFCACANFLLLFWFWALIFLSVSFVFLMQKARQKATFVLNKRQTTVSINY